MRRQDKSMRLFIAAYFLLLTIGCAPVPREPSESGDLPPISILVMKAKIVDINSDTGVVTVKEVERYETWTVAVIESTEIRTLDGDYLEVTDLRIGEEIEIRGRSRIGNLCTASEISILDERPGRKQTPP